MRFLLLTVLSLVFALLWSPGASADDGVTYCGSPTVFTVESVPFTYCDIYTRQIEYRGTSLELHREMVERQKNFAHVAAVARENYAKNLQAMYDREKEEALKAAEEAAEAEKAAKEEAGEETPVVN